MEQPKHCSIYVLANGERHEIHCTATSLFDAAAQAIESWSKLWWWSPDAVLDVCCEGQRWRVRARKVAAWVRAKHRDT